MSSTSPPDHVALPTPFSSIPRTPLLFPTPSPIQPLPRISAALAASSSIGGAPISVSAKREDVNSGLAFGGNKVRKLEYLAADALARGATHLVSIGGVQSNHTRAVAATAVALGLQCRLVQEKWVDWDDAGYDRVGNIQLSRMMGTEPNIVNAEFNIGHKGTLRAVTAEIEAAGGAPYYIPAGASDHPLGGLGFARWAWELAQQEKVSGVFYGVIVVCVVTGSTLAGMIAGFKAVEKLGGGRKRRVVGIDASARVDETRAQTLRIACATAKLIGLDEGSVVDADVEIDDRFHAGVYGQPDSVTIDAMRFGARTEGFITDPVYEGKSLAALMHMVRNGEIEPGTNVLYAHLGGQLALNAYSSIEF